MTKCIITFVLCFALFLSCNAKDQPGGLENNLNIKPIKILSYNVRNCKGLDNKIDYKRVADIIDKVGADVVALQELDSITERSNKVFVLEKLATQTNMFPSYRASISYQGGKYGIGILTREKPLKTEGIPLPGKEEQRSLLLVELENYVVCCTHWSLTREDRISSVELVSKIAGKYSKPVFLAGDLNAEIGSTEMQNLEKGWLILNDPKQPTIPANDPRKCIDFILAKKDHKYEFKSVKSVVENEPVASDHLPVWVEIEITNSALYRSQNKTDESNGLKPVFTNPVWDGADPWMVKQNNEYIYCRSANNSILVYRSKKMTQRGESKKIWQAPATGWNRACVWAPEIHFIQGHWYVYYAAGESGPPFIHQRTGVLRSKTEEVLSDYEDMGVLYTGDNPDDPASNVWAIDMTILEHKSKLYCIWSGWIKQETTDATPQHLYISEMANPWTMKGKRVKLSSPVESWETGGPLNLNEGPEILKNSDKVFIIYSCRESWLIEYRLGMLQLINPDGNLVDPANWKKTGPVFQGNSEVFGVGHCSFVKSPDNNEDWVIYHSKKSTKPGWERDVRMQPFNWNADGTPDFGKAIPAGVPVKLPSGELE